MFIDILYSYYQVSPPSGWSFEPEEVMLKVDGETDACTLGQDINFHFKGFAVIGKVCNFNSQRGYAMACEICKIGIVGIVENA